MSKSEQNKAGVMIATFKDPSSEDAVPLPKIYEGKKVWYSEYRDMFLITDEHGNQLKNSRLTWESFEKFLDNDYFSFATPAIETYMLDLLDNHFGKSNNDDGDDGQRRLTPLNENYEDYEDDENDDYDDEYDEYEPDDDFDETEIVRRNRARRRSNRQDDRAENITEGKAARQKDPTRHIGVFMALTLVFAIIIAVVLNFGDPIVQEISKLLQ